MLLFCELNTDSNSCCCHYSTNKSSSLSLKMSIAQKRKYVHKTLREIWQSLKDLEKGLSNKDVAAKYGVSKNTLSNWVKSKEKGNNVKLQKLRTGDHETLTRLSSNGF